MTERQGLPALFDAVRRRWALALLVAVPLASAAGLYAGALPAQYDASTTVAFAPRLGSQVGADVVRVVLPRYVAYLTADSTVDTVASGLRTDPASLAGAVQVSVATDTANLAVAVRSQDPVAAAAAANAFAQAALVESADDDLLQGQQVAPALPPRQPAAPPRGLLQLAGLLAALLAGGGAAVLAERSRPRTRDACDVVSATGLPVLARLPTSRPLGQGGTVEVSDPQLGPAVRALVAQAERAAGPGGVTVVGVTSPSCGDGKTTLAIAYAAAVARQGRSVVLLDADLHRAGLSESLHLQGGAGPDLADLLADGDPRGGGPVEACLHEGPVDGVRVLPTGVRPGSVDLLVRRLPALLEQLRGIAEVVVVDCPPVQEDDGQAILAGLPAVLLVVSAGTPTATVEQARSLLDGLGARVLGVVLNHSVPLVARGYARAPLVGSA